MSRRRYAVTLHQGIALFAEELWDKKRFAYVVEGHAQTSTYSFAAAVTRERAMAELRRELLTHLRDAPKHPVESTVQISKADSPALVVVEA